ncbi:MAG: hypothetical protein K6G88_11095 [Lachnospiraceae bacterium]|nr:hypothetical protein [Lachnospiraceae bacterium]
MGREFEKIVKEIYDYCLNTKGFQFQYCDKPKIERIFSLEKFVTICNGDGEECEFVFDDGKDAPNLYDGSNVLTLYVDDFMAEQDACDKRLRGEGEVSVITWETPYLLNKILTSNVSFVRIYCNYYSIYIGIETLMDCFSDSDLLN